jgi:hypothetical protein
MESRTGLAEIQGTTQSREKAERKLALDLVAIIEKRKDGNPGATNGYSREGLTWKVDSLKCVTIIAPKTGQ